MTGRLSVCCLAAVLLCPQFAKAQAVGDTIHPIKGAPIRGTITAMTPDEVTVDSQAGARKIEVSEIRYIVYQDEPPALTQGRSAILQKNYNQAFEDLKKVDVNSSDRDVVKQDIQFFKALAAARLAMGEGGDKAAAEAAMKAFAGAHRGSYHFFESAEVLGDLASSSGKYDDASKYYGAIIAKAAKWPELQLRAQLSDGRALLATKKYDEATARFTEVIDSSLNSPETASLKTMAQVGKASAQAENGKADDAIKALDAIIEKNDPQDSRLFARTYVALGNAYLKANKPKDALMAFLHVDTLYYSEADAHAEALYHLSKLWDKVNRADRAIAARNTLRDRYGGSVWSSAN